MKLTVTHIFFILLAIALLSNLGLNLKEGLEVRRNEIPEGEEDMYVLKSSIVPPVCPRCPSQSVCPRRKPCPACPPCARCPEPAFTCIKVPNYKSGGVSRWLPQGFGGGNDGGYGLGGGLGGAERNTPLPRLDDFSSF
jgi:hypothetical protein